MTFQDYTTGLHDLSVFAQRSAIISKSIPDIASKSAEYLENSSISTDLASSFEFISCDILEMARSDYDSLRRFGWFPFAEIGNELANSINLILIGMHKSSTDCQRRALELSVVAGYLSSEAIDKSTAKNWLKSQITTPQFTKALNGFASDGFPAEVNHDNEWVSKIREYYHSLCDSVHTRGERHSSRKENPFAGTYNGIPIHRFDAASLSQSSEKLIKTVGYVAFICAMINPISLFGMPLDEKFGLNPPASGFLYEEQSERLRKLIPREHIDSLMRCAEKSDACMSAIDWINSLPDLTDEELSQQSVEFQEFLDSNSPNRRNI